MSLLRVVVVDHEQFARNRLTHYLREMDCEVMAELQNGRELISWCMDHDPIDGLFMEVHLPDVTGLEVLVELPKPPQVVFLSTSPEYAIRAYDLEAIDYLLKPVQQLRLARSVVRLRTYLDSDRISPITVGRVNSATQRFVVKAGKGHVVFDLKNVTHFEVAEDCVWAWSGAKRFRTSWKKLGDVEKAFSNIGFLRIQRHVLLRLHAIVGIRSMPGGRCTVRLTEGHDLEVSRATTPKVRAFLGLA